MEHKIRRIILLGPQGAGKTTQAERIEQFLDINILLAGGVLRQEIKSKSEFGAKISEIVNSGGLIPDQWMIDLMVQNLNKEDYKNGFILDGFPRSIRQAKYLDEKTKIKIDKVFNIEISDEEAVDRLSNRRVCPNGHIFHLLYKLPKKEGLCDTCQLTLEQRVDDAPETVLKRLKIYRHETSKLLDYYHKQKKLVVFNGSESIELVSDDILNYLKAHVR